MLVAATFAFVFSLVGSSAEAFPTGQVGHSGSPDTGAATCANCHDGDGRRASLSLDTPTSMFVGETRTVSIVVRGGPAVVAGFNAAVVGSAGEVLASEAGTQLVQGEVTHTAPRPFTGNQAQFAFELQAPAEPTRIQLYVAAVSADGNGATTGDSVAVSEIAIAVIPEPTPTPTSTGSRGVIVTPTPTPQADEPSSADAVVDDNPSHADDGGAFGFGLSPRPGTSDASAGADAAADEPTADSSLALTGSEVVVPATLAVALFATGASTIVAGRRRQR